MRRSRITPRNHRLRTSNCELGVSAADGGRDRPEAGFVPSRRSPMAGKEKWHKGAADSTRKGKHSLGASGQPASPCHASGLPPREGEGPARPDCGIGGSSGRRKPSGCRCTKTGVTAARLPRQARQPVPSQQRGPSRAHEADARKQQRRAAATVAQAAPFTSSAPAQHQRHDARERRRGGHN